MTRLQDSIERLIGLRVEADTVPPRQGEVIAVFITSNGLYVTIIESDGIIFEVSASSLRLLDQLPPSFAEALKTARKEQDGE